MKKTATIVPRDYHDATGTRSGRTDGHMPDSGDGDQLSADNKKPEPRNRFRLTLEIVAAVASLVTIAGFVLAFVTDDSNRKPPQAASSAAPSASAPASGAVTPFPTEPAPAPTAPQTTALGVGRTPRPTPPPTPTRPRATRVPQNNGDPVEIPENTWVDFDSAKPAMQAAGDPDEVPPSIDVQIGPNNAYPNHGRIWSTDSPATCADQATSNDGKGFQQEVMLNEILTSQEGSAAYLCVVTSGERIGSLKVSSVANNRYAPYLIQYSF